MADSSSSQEWTLCPRSYARVALSRPARDMRSYRTGSPSSRAWPPGGQPARWPAHSARAVSDAGYATCSVTRFSSGETRTAMAIPAPAMSHIKEKLSALVA